MTLTDFLAAVKSIFNSAWKGLKDPTTGMQRYLENTKTSLRSTQGQLFVKEGEVKDLNKRLTYSKDESEKCIREKERYQSEAREERARSNQLLEMRIGQDPGFQNLNDKHRPEVIVQALKDLCNNQRLDLMDAIEGSEIDAKQLMQLPCRIVVRCYNIAEEHSRLCDAEIVKILHRTANCIEPSHSESTRSKLEQAQPSAGTTRKVVAETTGTDEPMDLASDPDVSIPGDSSPGGVDSADEVDAECLSEHGAADKQNSGEHGGPENCYQGSTVTVQAVNETGGGDSLEANEAMPQDEIRINGGISDATVEDKPEEVQPLRESSQLEVRQELKRRTTSRRVAHVAQKVTQELKLPENQDVAAFVTECARLTWYMVLQAVPISLQEAATGQPLDHGLFNLHAECRGERKLPVSMTMWPAVVTDSTGLSHNVQGASHFTVLEKGIAFTQSRED